LAAVSSDWRALQHVANELKKDRKIVLAAVAGRWRALQYVVEELRTDRQVLSVAFYGKTNCRVFEHQDDIQVLKAIFSHALRPRTHPFNRDLIRDAAVHRLSVLKLASEKLLEDPDIDQSVRTLRALHAGKDLDHKTLSQTRMRRRKTKSTVKQTDC